jgi:hypothetical protein
MATATAVTANKVKDIVFEWEGKDKNGKVVRGEMRAGGEAMVSASLRRQGVMVNKVKKRRMSGGRAIKQKDIAVFTRQLSTMMRAGVPLIQSFDIVARGSTNARMTRLLTDIRTDVETGTSLSAAFRKHPLYFDALYCNLVEAGEAGGILETLLDRLALYQEKTMAIKNKIKSALIYPVAVLVVAFVVLSVIMIFVIPAFRGRLQIFRSRSPGAHAFRHRVVKDLRQLLVSDLRHPGWRNVLLPSVLEALGQDAEGHGPTLVACSRLRRTRQQVVGRTVDANALDDVCCRRPACRSSRFSRRRVRECRIPGGHGTDPARRLDGLGIDHVDADHGRVSGHGSPNVRNRRRIGFARCDAGQGSRVL